MTSLRRSHTYFRSVEIQVGVCFSPVVASLLTACRRAVIQPCTNVAAEFLAQFDSAMVLSKLLCWAVDGASVIHHASDLPADQVHQAWQLVIKHSLAVETTHLHVPKV